MPGFATVKDTIFSGFTGRELRKHPPEVRELQFWLVTGPSRDAYGVYILEPDLAAYQLGRRPGTILSALAVLTDLRFCCWDEQSQFVWVIEMAHHQFSTPLKAVDYRCHAARKWYAALARNPWLGPWYDRYVLDFHLDKEPGSTPRRALLPEGATQGATQGAVPAPIYGTSGTDPLVPPGEEVLSAPARAFDPDEPLVSAELDRAFSQVWANYPNAVERQEARLAFVALRPTPAMVEQMLVAIEAQRTGGAWAKGFIPKLTNWLQKHRWLDKVQPEQPVVTERTSRTLRAAANFVQRRGAQ